MGTMDLRHRQQLDKHMEILIGKLDYEAVLPALVSRGVFGNCQAQDIKNKNSSAEDMRLAFIGLLQRSGDKAFDSFCKALHESGQYDILEQLNPSMFEELKATVDMRSPTKPEIFRDGEDGNLLTGCFKGHDSDDEKQHSSAACTTNPPTIKAVKDNERFYCAEKQAYPSVAATKGVFSDLRVPKGHLVKTLRIEEIYPNFSKPKGHAIIINNRDFYGPPNDVLPERLGTNVDCKNMGLLFSNLGYIVREKHNLKAQQILNEIARFALKSEHCEADSAVVIILSHGKEGRIYGVDGVTVEVNVLIEQLSPTNSPSLRNKPKLFFIQACRGDRYDRGEYTDGPTNRAVETGQLNKDEQVTLGIKLHELDLSDSKHLREKIPTFADILTCYATTPGYVSWRNSARGSWFIQAVCEVFARDAADTDILTMLTRVNRKVAEGFVTSCANQYKQMSECSHHLRKTFYFYPGVFFDELPEADRKLVKAELNMNS